MISQPVSGVKEEVSPGTLRDQCTRTSSVDVKHPARCRSTAPHSSSWNDTDSLAIQHRTTDLPHGVSRTPANLVGTTCTPIAPIASVTLSISVFFFFNSGCFGTGGEGGPPLHTTICLGAAGGVGGPIFSAGRDGDPDLMRFWRVLTGPALLIAIFFYCGEPDLPRLMAL